VLGTKTTEISSSKRKREIRLSAKAVMSSTELKMFYRLQEALPEHIVLSQVAYGAFLNATGAYRPRNEFDRKIIDYVILDQKGDFVCAIELDGASHHNEKTAATDAEKTKMPASAGLRLLRWDSNSIPRGDEIREKVLGKGKSPEASSRLV
jgi:very-short-patch-repair endonuclease